MSPYIKICIWPDSYWESAEELRILGIPPNRKNDYQVMYAHEDLFYDEVDEMVEKFVQGKPDHGLLQENEVPR